MPSEDEAFAAMDTNSDGAVDARELSAQIAASSKRNRDRDSKLSEAKIALIVDQQLPPMFERLDADGDGKIDAQELGADFAWLAHSLQLQWVWRRLRQDKAEL